MTVGQLKKLLERVADNTPILIPSSDHSYCNAEVDITTAILDLRRKHWSEDFDYEEDTNQSRRNVIVVS